MPTAIRVFGTLTSLLKSGDNTTPRKRFQDVDSSPCLRPESRGKLPRGPAAETMPLNSPRQGLATLQPACAKDAPLRSWLLWPLSLPEPKKTELLSNHSMPKSACLKTSGDLLINAFMYPQDQKKLGQNLSVDIIQLHRKDKKLWKKTLIFKLS